MSRALRLSIVALALLAPRAWSQPAPVGVVPTVPPSAQTAPAAADPAASPARSLQELLARVRAARVAGLAEDAARQKAFLEERDRQQSRLDAARAELAAASARASVLEQRFEITQRAVDARATELHARMGALEQVFHHLGEQGAALRTLLQDSAVAAEVGPARVQAIDALLRTAASGDRLPSAKELDGFWFELQRQLVEGGAVRRFEATVRAPDGTDARRTVSRVGSFGAVDTAGRYLRFRGEDGLLLDLPRQPDEDARDLAAEFVASNSGLQPFVLDPTGATDGAALDAAAARPSLGERLAASGVAGRLTLLLGLLAGVFAVWRLVLVEHWNAGLRAGAVLPVTHPVARLRATADAHASLDANSLEHVLHDAVLREMPAVELGLHGLRLVAAAAPLVGVLGTVVAVMQSPLQGDAVASLTLAPALASTVTGLAAGILVLVLQGVLAARARVLVHALDQEAAARVSLAAGGGAR